jgi:hypothetical protein
MNIFNYKDTVVETVESIRNSRKNINILACLLIIPYAFFAFIGLGFYLIGYIVTGLYMFAGALGFLILLGCLIIKREIYSIMIYLKENKYD